jgi:hypothetical protein
MDLPKPPKKVKKSGTAVPSLYSQRVKTQQFPDLVWTFCRTPSKPRRHHRGGLQPTRKPTLATSQALPLCMLEGVRPNVASAVHCVFPWDRPDLRTDLNPRQAIKRSFSRYPGVDALMLP